jgi:hypothetical protein
VLVRNGRMLRLSKDGVKTLCVLSTSTEGHYFVDCERIVRRMAFNFVKVLKMIMMWLVLKNKAETTM